MPLSNPKPAGSWLARHRGGVALCCSLFGFVCVEIASHLRLLPNGLTMLLQAFFEGAMVGSLADWFAVTAIFHYIPIPLLARHTHLLARKRASMTEGIADMVQNRWLSPAAIHTWLNKVSFCDLLNRYLFTKKENTQRLDTFVQQGMIFVSQHVTHPNVTLILCRFWQRTLHQCPLPTTLTLWFLKLVGKHDTETLLYRRLVVLIEFLQQHPRIMSNVSESLADQLQHSAAHSTWARTRFWIGKQFLKGDDDAEKLLYLLDKGLEGLKSQFLSMAEDPSHPTRRVIRRQFFHSMRHADKTGQSSDLINLIWQRLLPVLTDVDTAEQMARQIQREVSNMLLHDTHLQKTVCLFASHQIKLLLADAHRRPYWDEQIRARCITLIERYPHVIGNIVRESLSPERVSTALLVQQIEEKVGQEMQWIRVNGAVVGGIVAMLLALLRLAISTVG